MTSIFHNNRSLPSIVPFSVAFVYNPYVDGALPRSRIRFRLPARPQQYQYSSNKHATIKLHNPTLLLAAILEKKKGKKGSLFLIGCVDVTPRDTL